jgi:hypothetical protein
MNWIAQVRHVAAKDVRHSRWALIVYIGLIAAATVSFVTGHAFGPFPTKPSTNVEGMPDIFVTYLPMVAAILGLVASVSLLQSDSPTRANAFWASRPLSPSAVLGAKLAVVVIAIIGLPLIGVAIGLTSLDTSSVRTTSLVARCALPYGEWALAVLVVGALTEDLRGAAVALIAILLGAILTLAAFSKGSAENTSPGPSETASLIALAVFTVVVVMGSIALLAFLYRTRAKRPATWIAVALATSCLVFASFAQVALNARPRVQDGGTASLVLQLQPSDTGAWRHAARSLVVPVAPSPRSRIDDRTDFRSDSVWIELLDGKQVNVDGVTKATMTLGPPPLGAPVRWLGGAGEQSRGYLNVEPQPGVRGAIGNNARSVSVAGIVTSLQSRPIASLPLRIGESVVHDGRRIVIYGFSHDADSANVWIELSTVPRDQVLPIDDWTSTDNLRFALVNDARSEALMLRYWGGHSESGGLVLPWTQIQTRFSQFKSGTQDGPSHIVPLDDAWYKGARLVALEWSVVRRFRARGEVALR